MTSNLGFVKSLILLIIGSFISYYLSLKLLEASDKESLQISESIKLKTFGLHNLNLNRYEKCVSQNIIIPQDIDVTFKNVVCAEDIKDDIRFILDCIKGKVPKNVKLLSKPNGVILHGPPGTGKTMLAKAIAKECNIPFITLTSNVLENKYFGESQKILQGYFSLADKIKPCILFLDEIDGFLSSRNSLDQSNVNSVKTLFLTLMDGINSNNDKIFIFGATNRIDILDPAVKRRMSNHILMNNPNCEQIHTYLKYILPEEEFSKDCVSQLLGLSYNNINELMKYSCKHRYLENKIDLKWESKDFLKHVNKFKQ
tara:strand:- start:47 stop:985 length:939 start_codon:yes stop_codon:yes gene_type:complete